MPPIYVDHTIQKADKEGKEKPRGGGVCLARLSYLLSIESTADGGCFYRARFG
ncbi:MAG: hypothetical protein UY05_C0021G0004 [Candidatus Peregrinibacteria bacterium GW2011_GWA2_47_7]|nr:MAG: hypothetical protein UY05_C0021G0004 [Candidatus Peregrinibacteria bacterium GW2011_GWA2_47_7]